MFSMLAFIGTGKYINNRDDSTVKISEIASIDLIHSFLL